MRGRKPIDASWKRIEKSLAQTQRELRKLEREKLLYAATLEAKSIFAQSNEATEGEKRFAFICGVVTASFICLPLFLWIASNS